MKLELWMKENNYSQTQLADALNVKTIRLHQILRGRHHPHINFAKQICKFTNNQVTLEDIYDIPQYEDQKQKKLKEELKKLAKEEINKLISLIEEEKTEEKFCDDEKKDRK